MHMTVSASCGSNHHMLYIYSSLKSPTVTELSISACEFVYTIDDGNSGMMLQLI